MNADVSIGQNCAVGYNVVFITSNHSIRCNDNEIMMIRDGNDFVNTFIFNNNNSKSNYLLKENGYDMDMEVNVSNMKSNDKLIYIEYEIVSTSCKYEFKIEMSEML